MIDCKIERHIVDLQKYADDNGLTRNQISKMVGVTAMTLSDFFEFGKWNPKLSTLVAIEKAFIQHENRKK